jgi:hypothetical protein
MNAMLGSRYLKLGITQKQRIILQKIAAYRKWGI